MKTLTMTGLLLMFVTAAQAIDVENSICESFTLSGYLDMRYSRFGEDNEIPSNEFSVVRSGLEASAALTSNLDAELKLELRTDEVFLKNAFLEWSPLALAEFRGGQFKRETILGSSLSTWDLPLFERPLVHQLREELTYDGRDLGVHLGLEFPAGSSLELRGIAGIFNGDERGIEKTDNELLYSFRGEIGILPADLTFGGSLVSHRLGESDPDELNGYITTEEFQAFSVDLAMERMLSSRYGLDLYAEYSAGDNWSVYDPYTVDEYPEFKGFWTAANLSFYPEEIPGIERFSLCAGYDYVTEDTDSDNTEKQLSLIAAVYPAENVRFRFGGVRNTIKSGSSADSEEYTDLIAEVDLRF